MPRRHGKPCALYWLDRLSPAANRWRHPRDYKTKPMKYAVADRSDAATSAVGIQRVLEHLAHARLVHRLTALGEPFGLVPAVTKRFLLEP